MAKYFERIATRTPGYALELTAGSAVSSPAWGWIDDVGFGIDARIGNGSWVSLTTFGNIAAYDTRYIKSANVIAGSTPDNLELRYQDGIGYHTITYFVLPAGVTFVAGNTYSVEISVAKSYSVPDDWDLWTLYCEGATSPDNPGITGTFGTSSNPPGTITGVSSSISGRDATISWTKDAQATGYKLYRGTSPNPTALYQTLGDVSSYLDSGLTRGTTYYWRLKGTNSNGDSASYSSDTSQAVPQLVVPTNVACTWSGSNITLTWTKPTGAIGYQIFRSTTPGATVQLGSDLGDVSSFVDTTAITGTMYYYRIKAKYTGEISDYSAEVSTTIIILTTDVSAITPVHQGSNWTAITASTGATAYQWQSYSGGAWNDITGATSASYTITTPDPSLVAMQYRCKHSNSGGSIYSSATKLIFDQMSTSVYWNGTRLGMNLNQASNVPITLLSNLNIGSDNLTIDNAQLNFSCSATRYTLQTNGAILLKAFKEINNVGFQKINYNAYTTNVATFRFTSDSHFNDVTGNAVMKNCRIDSSIQFGDAEIGSGGHWGTFIPPDLSKLRIEDSIFKGGMYGDANGYTLHDVTGEDIDFDMAQFGGKPIRICGDNITWEWTTPGVGGFNCLGYAENVWKLGGYRAMHNFHVVNGVFSGGHEEQAGSDSPRPLCSGVVSAVTPTTITIDIDKIAYNVMVWDYYASLAATKTALLASSKPLKGSALLVNSGPSLGNYFDVTDQTESTPGSGVYDKLTVAVTPGAAAPINGPSWSDTTGISVGNRISVANAVIESHINGTHFILGENSPMDFGYMGNTAFNWQGNAYGNLVENCDALPDASATGRYNLAMGFCEASIIFDTDDAKAGAGCNAHNTYSNCFVHDYFTIAFMSATTTVRGPLEEELHYPGQDGRTASFSSYVAMTNNTYSADQDVSVIDCRNMTFAGNTTATPRTTYSLDYEAQGMTFAECPPSTYGWSSFVTYYPDYVPTADGGLQTPGLYTGDWSFLEHRPIGQESNSTWALRDPTGLVASYNVSTRKIDLIWNDNSTVETGYKLQRNVNTAGWIDLYTTSPDVTTYSDADIQMGKNYQYRVCATSAGGDSGWSTSNLVKLETANAVFFGMTA